MTEEGVQATPVAEDGGAGVRKALSWTLLGGFLFIANFARGVYAAHESQPSDRFQLLTTLGFMALLWYWFAQQMESHRPRLPMDMGVFIVVLWFVLVPYYLWRYERWRGLAKVTALVVLYAASWLVAVVTGFLLS